jgi:hypothetical protein
MRQSAAENWLERREGRSRCGPLVEVGTYPD